MHNFYQGEILLINKPLGWTSFQAVNKIKHGLKKHSSLFVDEKFVHLKIGHAGTLDPLATGLLIICTGKKTKEIQTFQDLTKEYTGTFFIGATTPCYDLEKPIDETFPIEHITEELILEAVKKFIGTQQQTPPLFSAIRINGERAYDIARKGETVELKARTIEISKFEITRIELPEIDFRIVCSKGTYIRSIARDLGSALNSGAHLIKLCRTKIGDFDIKNAREPNAFLQAFNEY
ncbi:MAG TPA: tRNA pseudouridine(55) synthase TruB [Bacteroidia bacterium]|jgi:tRNA pseudouridine55 synthase|nr:tRNA pseudouridine(55) synthase TruB [Bacteroidia bacterium]